jgi:DNA-binding transcriptional LysR family regulator
MHTREGGILAFDAMIGPRGFGFAGDSIDLFHDRFVCVVDPANPWLTNGELTMDAIRRMPHARGVMGVAHVTPVDRRLAELGIDRRVGVTAGGWLPLPYLVAGTPLVGVIPERLAQRVAESAGVLVVEPPFGDIPLAEALWWHPARSGDAGNRWLRTVIAAASADLDIQHGHC